MSKLLALIKCHLRYLFSKATVAIIVILVLFNLIIFLTNAVENENALLKENIYNYYYSSIMISKVIVIMFTSFLMIYAFTIKLDGYSQLLIVNGIDKRRIIITKLLVIYFVIMALVFVLLLLFLFVGFIFIRGFVFEITYLETFISLGLISFIYGTYGMILMLTINNYFTFLVPIISSIVSQEIIDENISIFEKIYLFFFPTFSYKSNGAICSYYNNMLLVWLLLFACSIAILIYTKQSCKME